MLNQFFDPAGIAIIGATRHKEKLGYQILHNLIISGFNGKIFPVNPESTEILSLKTYKNVCEIEDEIDLAIIIVPAVIVPIVLEECIIKKIPYAIIISSGFSEIGENGKEIQEKIKKIILDSKIRVLGPNCLGMFNTKNNLNATFAAPNLQKGNISAVFQSGALGVALLDWAHKFNFGFSKFVSLGNKIDLDESDFISYFANDPETKVIAVYLEQIKNPHKFLEVCRKVSIEKPIVLLKGGMTNLGAKAAFSHTASIVGSKEITKAILSQSNVIFARSIEEMLNLIQILTSEPKMKGDRVAIVTNAGGPGILATDMADTLKIKLPSPSRSDLINLQKQFSANVSLKNPFDLTGEAKASSYKKILEYVLSSENYDAVLLLLTPQTATEVELTAKVLAERNNARKPVIASFLGDRAVLQGVEILRRASVPHFDDPELGIYALWKINEYYKKNEKNKKIIQINKNEVEILDLDALSLVQSYNIPVTKSVVVENQTEVKHAIKNLKTPLVMKTASENIVHKFRAGKIVLNIETEADFNLALKKIGFPILVQEMVNAPFEIFLGAKKDENYGTVLTFGYGGVYVEDFLDISTRILPLTEDDLDEMIKETKIGQILIKENISLDKTKNTLIEIAQLMTDFPQISELDLNPIKIGPETFVCVDARYKTS